MRVSVSTPYGDRSVEVVFCIQNGNGAFYTEIRQGRPVFESGSTEFATHFDSPQDAESLMADPQFGAPQSFAGCVVVPAE